MASLEVLHTQNDPEPFPSGDYSLLNEVRVPVVNAQTSEPHPKNDTFDFTNMQSALNASAALPDLSVEVHPQITELIEENDRLKEEMNVRVTVMAGTLKRATEEILSLQKENSELHKKIADLEKNGQMQEKSCMKVQSPVLQQEYASLRTDEETGFEVIHLKECKNPEESVRRLESELKNKDAEITCLKRERENFIEKLNAYELKIQECEAVLKSQCELLNSKLQSESSVSQEYKESCRNLEQQVKGFQLKLEQNTARMSEDQTAQKLKEEISNLEEALKVQQQTNKKDKEKILEIMTKCEKLQVDYDRVTKLLEIQSRDEKEKSKDLTLEAKRYLEESDHLTAKLIEVQEQLEYKKEEIQKLQDRLAQEARKKPHSSRHQDRKSDQKSETDGPALCITCPICDAGFTDERAAQNHINRCLEENE